MNQEQKLVTKLLELAGDFPFFPTSEPDQYYNCFEDFTKLFQDVPNIKVTLYSDPLEIIITPNFEPVVGKEGKESTRVNEIHVEDFLKSVEYVEKYLRMLDEPYTKYSEGSTLVSFNLQSNLDVEENE